MPIFEIDAGFRSHVRYFNMLEPTNMCYYVSEILDAGEDGPLFKVNGKEYQILSHFLLLPKKSYVRTALCPTLYTRVVPFGFIENWGTDLFLRMKLS